MVMIRLYALVFLRAYPLSESRASEAASGRTMTAGASEASTLVGPIIHALAAEDVQTIHKVKHAIAVDGVILRITAHGCRDVTTDVTLVAQDVEHLEGDCGCVALEEVLGDLSIPDKFVRIHVLTAVTAAAAV